MSSSIMKALVLLLWLACACWCKPTTVVSFSPVGYSPGVAPGFAYAFRAPAPLYPSSVGGGAGRSLLSGAVSNHVPTVLKTQYHSQDQLGQYAYGYVGDASTAHEVRTKDGAVRGSYTYLDSDGEVQSASYVADRNGFRVEATNLPQAPPAPAPVVISLPQPVKPTPEVVAATAAHLRAVQEVKAARLKRAASTTTYIPSPSVKLPFMKHADAVEVEPIMHVPALIKKVVIPSKADPNDVQPEAPVTFPGWLAGARSSPVFVLVADNSVSDASVVAPSHIFSQFHAQDELGRYEYSFEGGPSSRQEAQNADGNRRGSYSYIDSNGELQTVSYVADDLNGFRVLTNSLPEGPVDPY